MSCSSSGQSMYIYDLPFVERKNLCKILDLNDAWEELGGAHLGYDVGTLYHFKQAYIRNSSPTSELLHSWGTQNHTVLELYIHLSDMHHYQAMTVLKPFVSHIYHNLLHKGEENPDRVLNQADGANKCRDPDREVNIGKNMVFGHHNFDCVNKHTPTNPCKEEKKILNTPEDVLNNKPACKASDIKEASENNFRQICYNDLKVATGSWDSKNLLGKGGFGAVYKGTWKCTEVAIKRLDVQPCKESEDKAKYQSQLVTELKSLIKYRHDNILPLYAYSVGGDHDCLIYQYMRNGSLEDKLLCRDGSRPLSWSERHSIAIGVALGLHFLHTSEDKPLVHGDIKSANILLDPSLVPKIGDFGLAREGPVENYTYIKVSRVHGTRPYLPFEFLRDRKFSTKVDVYSFGVVLFELASGLRAYDDKRRHKLLKDHIESVPDDQIFNPPFVFSDPKIVPVNVISFSALITLGKRCTASKPRNRPEMECIHNELKGMQCTTELNQLLPQIHINSASDPDTTRNRQVTASVQPHSPKLPSPYLPSAPPPNFDLPQVQPQLPSGHNSVSTTSSIDVSASRFSLSQSPNGDSPQNLVPSSVPSHHSSQGTSSNDPGIPAFSILLP